MKNKINKEERRSMDATPTPPSNTEPPTLSLGHNTYKSFRDLLRTVYFLIKLTTLFINYLFI
jgi:hypothetical protein